MPIKIEVNGTQKWIFPKANWQTMNIESDTLEINENFLVYSTKL